MLELKIKKYVLGLLTSLMVLMAIPTFVWADVDKDAVILYTNDVHCAMDGYAELAAYAAQLEADGQEVLIVDAGDHIQGEAIGTLTEGEALVDIMNAVGYDYAIPGNHEFDYSMDKFLEIKGAMSDYKYLSSNFIDLRTASGVLDAYDIVELNGEKIAFIGVTTPETLISSTISYFKDEYGNYIYDFSQADLYEVVQNAVDAARADGAQRVIVLAHLGITGTTAGWKSTDVIENTTGIDVVLDGHSEEVIHGGVYKNKNDEDVLVSSTGKKFAYFGELILDDENVETTKLIDPDSVDTDVSEAAKSAYEKVQSKIDDYNAQMDFLYEVLGTSEGELVSESAGIRIVRNQETNSGDFVTDAYRAVTGAEIALCNGGGVRANLAAGDVTREALMALNPWSNDMQVAKVTGQQILDALEYGVRIYPELNGGFLQVSGLTYEVHAYHDSPFIMNSDNTCAGIDNTKPRRVTNVKVNGEPLEKDRLYTVAATEYLFDNHGDGFMMLKNREIIASEGLANDAKMLEEYLTQNLNGVISNSQYGNKNGDGRIKIYTSEGELYNYLKVAGISVNSSNAEDILGDGTASYDIETNTLTLENANISVTKESKDYAVYAKGDLNIALKGENRLNSGYYYGIAVVDPANTDSVNVTISGDGSLDSYGADGGIFIRGSLTIGENVDVIGRCGEVASGNAYGIRAYNDIEICGNAKVKAQPGSAPEYSYGIYAGDNFTACGDSRVMTIGGKGAKRSAGLYAISNIYIKDNALVHTEGVDTSGLGRFASESYGIRTTHMYVSGGVLNALGRGASNGGMSTGIFTQDFEQTGGTVNTVSENGVNAQSAGIQATKSMKIEDGTLIAKSGDTTGDSWGICASSGIQISGGEVNAIAGSGDNTFGIQANKIDISAGEMVVDVADAVSQSRGIQSGDECTISGGQIAILVGDAGIQSYGLQSSGTISITNSKIYAETGTAPNGSAIEAFLDIIISDSELGVKSEGNGIKSFWGSVEIASTDVKAAKNQPALEGTRVMVDAKKYSIYGKNGITISDKLVIEVPEKGIVTQSQTEDGEAYYYISLEDGNTTGKAEIIPLGYSVTIKGLSYGMSVLVPAGKSVNEAYCELYGINDFTEAMDITKEGYTFVGLYTDEAGTDENVYTFDTEVTEDLILYAVWAKLPEEPGNTDEPEDVQKPEDTDKPENTQKPEDTDKPENTQKPNGKEDNGGVNTGDSAQITLWMSLCIGMLTIAAVLRKRYIRG